jgi:glycosyltransferase involved in cell wall biosynthesis
MEYRPFYLAREWVKAGHGVTIVAASFAHVRSRQPVVRGSLASENIDGIRFVWLKTPDYTGNGLSRIVNMLAFVRRLYAGRKELMREGGFDAVVASSTYPLDIYPCRKIARLCGARLFFEVHDLWPLSPMELGGYKRWHPFIMITQAAENYAYRHAHGVISLLPLTLDHMVAHGLKKEKFHYIPNGVVPEESLRPGPLPAEHVSMLDNVRKRGFNIVAYVGSHGLANALYYFVEAARLCRDDKIGFVLVGDGPEKPKLIRQAGDLNSGNVFFLPPVPKASAQAFLGRCDILYIGLQKQPLFRFGISPNKLFDYMLAAKPIIQAIDAGNDPVKEASCGISIEPENPHALADAVRTLLSWSPEERQQAGLRGREYVMKNHDYRVLAARFAGVLEENS